MADREKLIELFAPTSLDFEQAGHLADHLITNGVTIPVHCKECIHHRWKQEPCHGKTVHYCEVLKAEVWKDFFCYYGKHKE